MQRFIYLILCTIIVSISSCKGDAPSGTDLDIDTTIIDTSLGIDTTNINPIDTVAVDSAGYIDEDSALTTQIEKKYGEQWEFCDCVVRNDSVNTAIMETDDDAQIDLIIMRMDTIEKHCKELLTTPNTTPDERARHERKVNKCLKAAR
ncbi:MAG: hypothetical protein GQ574_22550 [Crocinitomix sp.]|nr:hypothetical protein [Crocinitomix sp.]